MVIEYCLVIQNHLNPSCASLKLDTRSWMRHQRHWYNCPCKDQNEERLRILKTAAMIIKQDLQSRIYDTSHYSPSCTFLDDAETIIPESLKLYLDSLLAHMNTKDRKPKEKYFIGPYYHQHNSAKKLHFFGAPRDCVFYQW